MLGDVDRVEPVTQGHEYAAVVGVLLGDPKAEHVAVEPLRGLLVGDAQQHMTDARKIDHRSLPLLRRSCRHVSAGALPAV
jgi:hypothetical protein